MNARNAPAPVCLYALVVGDTYPCREALRAMGGIWCATERGWLLPLAKYDSARRIVDGAPVPLAPIVVDAVELATPDPVAVEPLNARVARPVAPVVAAIEASAAKHRARVDAARAASQIDPTAAEYVARYETAAPGSFVVRDIMSAPAAAPAPRRAPAPVEPVSTRDNEATVLRATLLAKSGARLSLYVRTHATQICCLGIGFAKPRDVIEFADRAGADLATQLRARLLRAA